MKKNIQDIDIKTFEEFYNDSETIITDEIWDLINDLSDNQSYFKNNDIETHSKFVELKELLDNWLDK